MCSFRLNKEIAVYYLRTQFTPRSSSHFRLLLCFQSSFKSRCFNLEVMRRAIIKFLTLDGNQTLASPVPQTLVFLLQRSRSQKRLKETCLFALLSFRAAHFCYIAAMCTHPVQPVCTSLLFILLFIKSQYTVFALFIPVHIYSLFLFFIIYMLLCCVTFILFYFYSFALSTERT